MPVQTTKAPSGALTRAIDRLVKRHRSMKDEPLLLAIHYRPRRRPQDVFLFEVIEGFGAGKIDSERELFEVTYSDPSGFPLKAGQRLHLLLTNPQEFERAVAENWKSLAELRGAIKAGDSRTVYSDPESRHLRELIDA